MEMGNYSSSERKKGPETATAIRSTVSFSSSSSAGTRPSCWRSVVTTATTTRRRSGGCCGADEHDTAATTGMPASASILHGNHLLGIGKKVDARAGAGAAAVVVRKLVERNDFYCQECNTHGK
uniref:Uncharacterized protein n=1 Tax=Oryza punctata TaxID=4537 RepID=A0A0E0JH77_ORYPU